MKVIVLGELKPHNFVEKSTSWHQFDTSVTKLHGVTCRKTVTFTFNVLQFTTLRTR